MTYPYLIQGKNIVVVIDNKPHTITTSHIGYQKIKDAIRLGRWDAVKDIIEPKQVVLIMAQEMFPSRAIRCSGRARNCIPHWQLD